jgi:hypothetical protein
MNFLSPKSLFFSLPDIDLQHIIPEISVMYNWMVIPYLLGVYLMFRNLKQISFKFLVLTFFVSLVPAVFSGRFISIQRALPFLLPLVAVIGLGIDKLAKILPRILYLSLMVLLFIYSLLMLYRSYFVLFPKEGALAWNYGYEELSGYIAGNSDIHFTIDNTRNPRSYMELLYFLRYAPESYQKEVDTLYRENYYQAPNQKNEFYFSNIEVRNIDWGKDSCKDQIIVGDNLTVSDRQAEDHGLTEVKEIKNFDNSIIFKLYKTNPGEQCS